MLSCAEESVTDLSVCNREWVVHDANATLILNGQTNQYSDGWQVALHEIIRSIEWVNPHARVLGTESLEWVD